MHRKFYYFQSNNPAVQDMELNEFMKKYKKAVEAELQAFFQEKDRELDHWSSIEAKRIIEEYTLRGGKRIRAILMILAYMMYGGKNEKAIVEASSALELIQSYLLIHDDIMDESELRRGKKTVHRIYEDIHLKSGFSGNPRRFGESMALIAGDLANSYAMQILTRSKFPADLKIQAINKLNEVIEYTGYGQIIDIYSSMVDDFGEEELLLLHKYKTARYTVEGPLLLGAILAGRGDEEEKIRKFAIPIGIAFQLQDDILGLFGDEERIGKPVTSDLAEGKKTLLIIKALEWGNDEDRKKILAALGNPAVTVEQLEEVRQIVRKTGSLDYSQKMAERLVDEGCTALNDLDVKNEYRNILFQLAQYLIRRKF